MNATSITDRPASRITAREVMSTPVVCVRSDVTVWRARQVLANAGFRHLVVLSGERCIGVIDEQDITASMLALNGGRQRVVDVLNTRSVSVHEDEPIEQVAELVLRSPSHAVPVVDHDGHVAGLVTASDIVALVARRQAVGG